MNIKEVTPKTANIIIYNITAKNLYKINPTTNAIIIHIAIFKLFILVYVISNTFFCVL